jgi:hypothetical protein
VAVNFVLWEKLALKRTIWNLRVLFCTTRVRLLVPMFEIASVFDNWSQIQGRSGP